MPWQTVSEHSGFFGAILGAATGGAASWAASWAALRQWMKNKEEDDRHRDALIEDHGKQLEELKVTRRELVMRDDCRREHDKCQSILCRKLEDMTQALRDNNIQTVENSKSIATILEHLRGLEKRYDDNLQRVEVIKRRHQEMV